MNNNNVEIQFFPNEAIKAIQRYQSKKMEVFSLVKGANAVLYVIRSFSENTEKFDLVAYGETGFLETIRKNAANLSENSNAETVFQAKHCLKKIQYDNFLPDTAAHSATGMPGETVRDKYF